MPTRPSNADRRLLQAVDAHLTRAALEARSLVERVRPQNLEERPARIAALRRRAVLPALLHAEAGQGSEEAFKSVEEGRRLAAGAIMASAYAARFDELELELRMLEAVGTASLVELSLQRFGAGSSKLAEQAASLLGSLSDQEDPPEEPVASDLVAALFRALATGAGLPVTVRIEPSMSSLAAAGERTVFVSSRALPKREALRVAVHEVLGHLTAAANAREHRFALPRVGSAGSLRDQEGLALQLEAESGLLSVARLRRVAARTLAVRMLEDGADFSACAFALHYDYGLCEGDAVDVSTRAFRGGGFARDAIYLSGWQRVRRAQRRDASSLESLRLGRFSVDDLAEFEALVEAGWLSPARYRPSLSRSLSATGPGTSSETLPPSLAASLMILDET